MFYFITSVVLLAFIYCCIFLSPRTLSPKKTKLALFSNLKFGYSEDSLVTVFGSPGNVFIHLDVLLSNKANVKLATANVFLTLRSQSHNNPKLEKIPDIPQPLCGNIFIFSFLFFSFGNWGWVESK
jgi:hypothetical protein